MKRRPWGVIDPQNELGGVELPRRRHPTEDKLGNLLALFAVAALLIGILVSGFQCGRYEAANEWPKTIGRTK